MESGAYTTYSEEFNCEDVLMFCLEHQLQNGVKECLHEIRQSATPLSRECQTRLVIAAMPRTLSDLTGAAQLMDLNMLLEYSQILRGLQFVRSNCTSSKEISAFASCSLKLKKAIIMHMICNEQTAEQVMWQLEEQLGVSCAQSLVHPSENPRLVTVLKREVNIFRHLISNLLEDAESRINYMQGEMWNDFNEKFWATLSTDLAAYLKTVKSSLKPLKIEKILDQNGRHIRNKTLSNIQQQYAKGLEISNTDILALIESTQDGQTNFVAANGDIIPALKDSAIKCNCSVKLSEKCATIADVVTLENLSEHCVKTFYGKQQKSKIILRKYSNDMSEDGDSSSKNVLKVENGKRNPDSSSKRPVLSPIHNTKETKRLRFCAEEVAALLLTDSPLSEKTCSLSQVESYENYQNQEKTDISMESCPTVSHYFSKSHSKLFHSSSPRKSDLEYKLCCTSPRVVLHKKIQLASNGVTKCTSPLRRSQRKIRKKLQYDGRSNSVAEINCANKTNEDRALFKTLPEGLASAQYVENSSDDYVSESECSDNDIILGLDDPFIPDFNIHDSWNLHPDPTSPTVSLRRLNLLTH
ncbi:uncharacterized protein LOC143464733 [Clavelina lepadiformis]|uniref:uncharacterized protein LOC143464733 n=1 Tax=Clavelina lepadiformis TaxID=159417 RepID=UPI0040416D05